MFSGLKPVKNKQKMFSNAIIQPTKGGNSLSHFNVGGGGSLGTLGG